MGVLEEWGDILGRWDYTTLGPTVRIGKGCFLERKDSFSTYRSTRDPGLVIGDGVEIYTWSAFNVEPGGRIVIGRDSVLVGAVFMCAEDVSIGERVTVSYNVTIADCDFHPRDPNERIRDAVANAPQGDRSLRPPLVAKPVVIEDDVSIGIGAIVLKGVTVGAGAQIGAGAVVTGDVSPGSVVAGNPARAVGGAG